MWRWLPRLANACCLEEPQQRQPRLELLAHGCQLGHDQLLVGVGRLEIGGLSLAEASAPSATTAAMAMAVIRGSR